MEKEIYNKLEVFTSNFNDNFETLLAVYYKILQSLAENLATATDVEINGDFLNGPSKTVQVLHKKLEDFVKKYDVKINKNPPTEDEILRVIGEFSRKGGDCDVREKLIEGSLEIFRCYERQFSKFNEDDIEKLSKEAANKVFKYCFTKGSKKFDKSLITKALCANFDSDNGLIQLSWEELFKKLMSKFLPRTVQNPAMIIDDTGNVIEVSKFYTHVGTIKDDKIFVTETSDLKKYGYRQRFKHELTDEDFSARTKTTQIPDYTFVLKPSEDITKLVKYIKNRDVPDEEVRNRIGACKRTIENEIASIRKDYHMVVFKDMLHLLNSAKIALETTEEEEDEKKPESKAGSTNVDISRNKIDTWNWKTSF